MANPDSHEELNDRLHRLSLKQASLAEEILQLRKLVFELRLQEKKGSNTGPVPVPVSPISEEKPVPLPPAEKSTHRAAPPLPVSEIPVSIPSPFVRPHNTMRQVPEKGFLQLEKYIGENLISKAGILILIVGVGIGVKYAVDRDLISATGRIILSYLAGLILLAVSFRLFVKYRSFSAVLLGGAMAILYFTTYFAFDYYQLIGQVPAFGLMVLFTGFTVLASIRYDRQLIAVLGLLGACAVPFLLSDGGGRVAVLYNYLFLLNTGILLLAFRKRWLPLLYLSFSLTWLVFTAASLSSGGYKWLNFLFVNLFFLQCLGMQMGQKWKRLDPFSRGDLIMLGANAFLGFSLGYYHLTRMDGGERYTGLFTVAYAAIHLLLAWWAARKKLFGHTVPYMLGAMGMAFVSIAVPVQTSGTFITLLWAGQSAVFAYLSARLQISAARPFALLLMLLTALSYALDVNRHLESEAFFEQYLLVNNLFLTGVVTTLAYGLIAWWYRSPRAGQTLQAQAQNKQLHILSQAGLAIVLFTALMIELDRGFCIWQQDTRILLKGYRGSTYPVYDTEIARMQEGARLFFLLLWSGLAGWMLDRKIKRARPAAAWIVAQILLLPASLMAGLLICGYWREDWLLHRDKGLFPTGLGFLVFRYLLLFTLIIGTWLLHRIMRASYAPEWFRQRPWELACHLAIIWWGSSELVQWIDIAGGRSEFKLGLSILWGLYALLLVSLGIGQKKSWLRLAGIILFSVTLVKLFLYDLSSLSAIGKTIVFIALGALLLISSFLYNKYRHLIEDENTPPRPVVPPDNDAGPGTARL